MAWKDAKLKELKSSRGRHFICGLRRLMYEILQERFRMLLHQKGKSEGWSSGNFNQSLYSVCTADLEIVAFSAVLAFSESVS